mgnify:FL=1
MSMAGERTLQVVGVLLLLGVIAMGVLTYTEMTGHTQILEAIKEGVDALKNWFIPSVSELSITTGEYSGLTITKEDNKVTITGNLSAGSKYTIVTAELKTDKEATLILDISNGLSNTSVDITVTATDAIVDGSKSISVAAGSSQLIKWIVYPKTENATVKVQLVLEPTTDDSGTITAEFLVSYRK